MSFRNCFVSWGNGSLKVFSSQWFSAEDFMPRETSLHHKWRCASPSTKSPCVVLLWKRRGPGEFPRQSALKYQDSEIHVHHFIVLPAPSSSKYYWVFLILKYYIPFKYTFSQTIVYFSHIEWVEEMNPLASWIRFKFTWEFLWGNSMVYVCVWLLESKLKRKPVFLFRGKFLFDSFLMYTEIILLKNPKCEVKRRGWGEFCVVPRIDFFKKIDPIFIVEQLNSFVQLREPSHLTPK